MGQNQFIVPTLLILLLFLQGCAEAVQQQGAPVTPLPPPGKAEAQNKVTKTVKEREAEKTAARINDQINQDLAELKTRGTDMLLGRDRAQMSALLGSPHFIRQDDPAIVWLYQGTSCFLDVFFYSQDQWRENMRDFIDQKQENGQTQTYRVTYYNMRPQKNQKISIFQCVSGFLKHRV